MRYLLADPPLDPPRDYELSARDEERLDFLARSIACEEFFPDVPRLEDLELIGPKPSADGYCYRVRWDGREEEIILAADVLDVPPLDLED